MALDAYKAVALPKAAWEGYQATPEDVANFALTVGAGGLGSSALMKEGGENAAGMFKAYHGSPHDFDQFSMDKIGTGEGAQAYGHGLYFAENEGVAKDYRAKLSGVSDDLERAYAEHASPNGYFAYGSQTYSSPKEILRDVERGALDANVLPESLRSALKPAGRMYEVNINADPDDFLDWDKPLSEQSERVRGAVSTMRDSATPGFSEFLGAKIADDEPGRRFVSAAEIQAGGATGPSRDGGSQMMREAGIPGIRYLDQGSRTAGDGSRNYVVFDDKLIDIIKKYGMAGLLAGGAGANAMGEFTGPQE
jgi:hypothetical protein